jgi:hypothetical protein
MSYSPEKINEAIKAKIVMISGCEDKQTSADVSNVGTFELPNPGGKAGGACTSALIKVLNEHSGPLSWIDMLEKMRTVLDQKGFDQIPQITSSRMLDVNSAFEIVPRNSNGAKRAILIGINYVGTYVIHKEVNFRSERMMMLIFSLLLYPRPTGSVEWMSQ